MSTFEGENSEYRRLQSERYKYCSDCRPGPPGQNVIVNVRLVEKDSFYFVFYYVFPPADEVHVWEIITYSSQEAKNKFGKFLAGKLTVLCLENGGTKSQRLEKEKIGKQSKVIKIEEIPIGKQPYSVYYERTEKPDGRRRPWTFVSDSKAKQRYRSPELKQYIRKTAHLLSRLRIDVEQELTQAAWIRVMTTSTDDLTELKAEALTAMKTEARLERARRQKTQNF